MAGSVVPPFVIGRDPAESAGGAFEARYHGEAAFLQGVPDRDHLAFKMAGVEDRKERLGGTIAMPLKAAEELFEPLRMVDELAGHEEGGDVHHDRVDVFVAFEDIEETVEVRTLGTADCAAHVER